MSTEKIQAGFTFLVETIKDGIVVDREEVHNIMPYEGMNHMLNTMLKSGAQVAQWYIGLYEGAYTPILADTMATFPGTATESSAYDEAIRQNYTPGTVTNGAVDNAAAPAEFTMNATKTIYGMFISSAPTIGATSGTLVSAVRFATAKSVQDDTVLRVTAGFSVTSS